MSLHTPAMAAALAADRQIPVLLIEAALPDGPLRLMFGSGTVLWGDKAFSDTDPRFGTIAAVDELGDGLGDSAPPWSFVMIPHSDAAAAALCSPAYQEADVLIWLGALSPTTNRLLPDPMLLDYRKWDIGTLAPDKGSREVEIECLDAFALLLEEDEGARLSDSHHQSIWPGELGLANVTGLDEPRYWGLATPRGSGTTVVPTDGMFGAFA